MSQNLLKGIQAQLHHLQVRLGRPWDVTGNLVITFIAMTHLCQIRWPP